MTQRPQKITFREMRESGVRHVLIFCSDYKCSHSTEMDADQWPDDLRLSDIEASSSVGLAANAAPMYGRGFHTLAWNTDEIRHQSTLRRS
jgi:hypothetical protein